MDQFKDPGSYSDEVDFPLTGGILRLVQLWIRSYVDSLHADLP